MIKLKYYMRNRRDQFVSFHYHHYYELTYYKVGSGYSEFKTYNGETNIKTEITTTYVNKKGNYKKLNFDENSLVIYPPFTIHSKYHYSDVDIYAFVFEITDDDFKFDCQVINNISYKLQKLISLAVTECEQKKYKYLEMAESIINEICIEINRELKYPTVIDKKNQIKEIVSYIDDYFLTNINFDDIAKRVGYSADRFRHIFKEEVGMSPKQYVLELKMQYAKEQIINSDLKINYIATACGYSDYIQFSTYFKKRFGISPKALRDSK